MYLYELALELDEKSVDLAARASALGLAGAGPSSQLNKHQVAALRNNVPMPELGEDGEPVGGALAFADGADGSPGSAEDAEPKRTPRPRIWPGRKATHDAPPIGVRRPRGDPEPRRPKRKVPKAQSLAVGVLGFMVIGLLGYMAMNVGSLDEKKQRLAVESERMEKLTSESSKAEAAAAAGAKLPDPGTIGIANGPEYCRGFARTYAWVTELTDLITEDASAPHSVNVPGWVRARGQRLDDALAQLRGATGGTIAADVARVGDAAAEARTSLAGAKTAAATAKAEGQWMTAIGEAEFTKSVRNLQIGRLAACR